MSATTRTTGDESGSEPTAQLPTTPTDTSGADQLLAAALSDTCTNCGAGLAPDQHYCVECGQRRGKPRFSLSGTPAPRETPSRPPRGPRRLSMSAGSTLIAGIATLLLALGVGVLIGHNNNATKSAGGVQVVTVAGGGGGGAATSTGSSASSSTGGSHGKSKGGKNGGGNKSTSKKAAAAATQAAASTLKPAAGIKIAPANTKQGGACTAGTAGCQGGHLTGNFFH